jgi:hypothetical protein
VCTCIELLWAWLEEHVLSRPEVWSATAGWVGAGVALYIGFVAHQFNKNARRGQSDARADQDGARHRFRANG